MLTLVELIAALVFCLGWNVTGWRKIPMTTSTVRSTSRTRMAIMARTMRTRSSGRVDDELYKRVARLLEQARGQVARSVNTAMVRAYWLVGREIVEVEQAGKQRAGYGQNILARLAARLKASFGKGFSVQNLG